MRTITQRTTFPFLMAESGAASFTDAVITSPNPALRLRSPPRGRMQESLRAPELSATSRIVRIPIIKSSRKTGVRSQKSECASAPTHSDFCLLSSAFLLDFHIQLRRLRAHLGGAANHFHQLPALQLAQGTVFHDADYVA